jgi:hypothetical protein
LPRVGFGGVARLVREGRAAAPAGVVLDR